jgi:hypothetical protein
VVSMIFVEEVRRRRGRVLCLYSVPAFPLPAAVSRTGSPVSVSRYSTVCGAAGSSLSLAPWRLLPVTPR